MRSTSTWCLCLALLTSCSLASAREDPPGPPAWVLSPDPAATGAWLEQAGFVVATLPLDRPPHELAGLVVLAAEASDMPEYHAYMQAYADDLPAFVARGGVLLQLAQSAAAEFSPPFLPPALLAGRGPVAGDAAMFTPHPLTAGLERADAWRLDGDGFVTHAGFAAPVLHADRSAALLVGEHGRGRFVLAALPLDRPLAEGSERSPLADEFAANLARHLACAP